MRRLTLPLMTAALLGAAVPAVAQKPAHSGGAPASPGPQLLDTAAVRRWREDLAFLAREMPARHANLFHAMPRAHFDSVLTALSERLPSMTRAGVIVELMRLAARIGDGHSNVSPWRDTVVAFHTLPVALYRFADGYYVRAANAQYASLLGARVTHIGGVPIDSAEALVNPLIARDNPMGPRMYAPLLLAMPEVLHAVGLSRDEGAAELTLSLDGRVRTVRLAQAGDAIFPFDEMVERAEQEHRVGHVHRRATEPVRLREHQFHCPAVRSFHAQPRHAGALTVSQPIDPVTIRTCEPGCSRQQTTQRSGNRAGCRFGRLTSALRAIISTIRQNARTS